MKVRQAWAGTTEQLSRSAVVDAGIEAEALLRHSLNMDRARFFASLDDDLDSSSSATIAELVERRIGGEPLAYMLESREFYGLDFYVNSDVLIPRQETELLVEMVLEFANERPERDLVIADVGTGSGAIAIALAHHLDRAAAYATDSSHEALLVADINRRRHGVEDRVHLVHGDLLDPLPAPVDVIVSNPPYLTAAQMGALARELRREPSQALNGGADGLDTTGRLIRQAPLHMHPAGRVLVEIAPEQLDSVFQIGQDAFPAAHLSYSRDLLGLARVVAIQLPSRKEQRVQSSAKALQGTRAGW